MKSIGDRLGRRKEAKRWGLDLWDWIKCEMIDTYFYTGEYRIVNCQLT